MRFILHLVDEGHITPEQAVEGLREHFESTPPLGKLALFSGKMTVRQVIHVLDKQVSQPEMLFGEVSVMEGFMSSDEVEALLEEQRRLRRSVEEALADQGYISAEAIEHYRTRWKLKAS